MNKIFHPMYPIEITGMSEVQVKQAVLSYCKSKGLNPRFNDETPVKKTPKKPRKVL